MLGRGKTPPVFCTHLPKSRLLLAAFFFYIEKDRR